MGGGRGGRARFVTPSQKPAQEQVKNWSKRKTPRANLEKKKNRGERQK